MSEQIRRKFSADLYEYQCIVRTATERELSEFKQEKGYNTNQVDEYKQQHSAKR